MMNYIIVNDIKNKNIDVIFNTYNDVLVENKFNEYYNSYNIIGNVDELYYKPPGFYSFKCYDVINIFEKQYSYMPLTNYYELVKIYYLKKINNNYYLTTDEKKNIIDDIKELKKD